MANKAKQTSNRTAVNFASPTSILLFKEDAAALAALSKKTGIQKSQFIRMAVSYALRRKIFDAAAAS